jgi:hypothetical protein
MRVFGELGALLYLGLLSAISSLPGASYVFFPELGALAHDVLVRPGGKWANALLSLCLMPVATATLGVAIALVLPYGYTSMLVVIAISVILLKVLRSPMAPAISAGVLPLVFDLKSWWYPVAILFGVSLLAGLTWGWRTWCRPRMPAAIASHRERVDDIIELPPHRWIWVLPFLVFLLVGISLVKLTGWRLILFPPIVVIAFEMFAHPSVCPWARKPLQMPLACFLTATAGFLAVSFLGAGVTATMLSFAVAVVILRWFDLHIPPALAVVLIPQVMPSVSWHYPVAVLMGTSLLTGHFVLYRRWLTRRRRDELPAPGRAGEAGSMEADPS